MSSDLWHPGRFWTARWCGKSCWRSGMRSSWCGRSRLRCWGRRSPGYGSLPCCCSGSDGSPAYRSHSSGPSARPVTSPPSGLWARACYEGNAVGLEPIQRCAYPESWWNSPPVHARGRNKTIKQLENHNIWERIINVISMSSLTEIGFLKEKEVEGHILEFSVFF